MSFFYEIKNVIEVQGAATQEEANKEIELYLRSSGLDIRKDVFSIGFSKLKEVPKGTRSWTMLYAKKRNKK